MIPRPVQIGLLFLVLLGVTEGGFALLADRVEGRSDDAYQVNLERSLAGVTEQFLDREERTRQAARLLADDIHQSGVLEAKGRLPRSELFRKLQEVSRLPSISGVLVTDVTGRVVAWEGKTFPDPGDRELTATSGIRRSRIYRVLHARERVGPAANPVGSVQVFSPFYINYPLHNRYLRATDFKEELKEQFKLRDLDISDPDQRPRRIDDDPSWLGATIMNREGKPLAQIAVRGYPVEAELARLNRTRQQVRGVVLGAILLTIVFLTLRFSGRAVGSWRRLALLAVVLLAVRSALFVAGFPGSLFTGEAFDPAWFSMLTEVPGLDLGLLHSPGDFLITGLFTMLFAIAALKLLERKARALAPERPDLKRGLPLLIAGFAASTVSIQLWLELMHLLVFNSTVVFFQEHSLLPGTAGSLLLAGLFLVTLALLPMLAAFILIPVRLLAGSSPTRRRIFLLLTGPVWFLAIQGISGLQPTAVGIMAVALTGGSFLISGWNRLSPGIRFFILTVLATVLAFPPFLVETWRETRADVEEEARELFLHTRELNFENRLKADLEGMAEDPWLISLLKASLEDPPRELAFRLWARSPLSRLPQGCDLLIRDRTGEKSLSHFEIDMPPLDLVPGPLTGTSLESLVTWWHWVDLGDRRARFLVAQAPVFSEEGDFVAQLIVRLASESDARRPEILRPVEEDALGADRRELFYSEYDGDRLARTTNPDYPGVHRADREVTRAILAEKLPLFWFREKIGGGTWINLYRPRITEGRITGMMSVGFRSRDERGLLLSFFQFLLVNALAALVISAARALIPLRKLEIKFQHKLLLSYLIVSAVPVMLLAEVNRTFARESIEDGMQETLRRGVRIVRGELARRKITGRLAAAAESGRRIADIRQFVDDEDLKEIGSRLGLEVNLFVPGAGGAWGAPLVASSEPGLFATELFSDRLSGRAWLETILLGREFFASPETAGGYSYLVGYSPIRDDRGEAIGAISLPLIFGQDAVDRELARRYSLILALYLLILLVVVFIGMVLARRISSPIEELATATRQLSAGDLDYRIPRRSRDEFGYLVDSFNQMTEDLRTSREQIVAAERDAAWREMAKQIAHEIKNPLTPMRLSAQHILRAFRDRHEDFGDILARGVDTIIRQTESLTRIAGEFSAFARLPLTERRPTNLTALAREVAGLYTGLTAVTIVEELEDTPEVIADPEELKRVLVNLATNAVQAMEQGGGTMTIRTGVITARFEGASRELVEVSFGDTGIGIPEEDMARLFHPNFSTRTGGTGLGLAMCKAVVEGVGGSISVESRVGVGSVFTVRIPIGAEDAVKP